MNKHRWILFKLSAILLTFILSVFTIILFELAVGSNAYSQLYLAKANAQSISSIEPSKSEINPEGIKISPVLLDGKTLFSVETKVGLLTIEERAKETSDKLRSVAKNRSISLDELKTSDFDSRGLTEILAGNDEIIAIFEADAKVSNTSRIHLAQQYLKSIKEAIARYRAARTPKNIILGLAKFICATIALVVICKLFQIFDKIVVNRTSYLVRPRIRSFNFGGSEIVSATQIIDVLNQSANLVRLLLFLTIFLIYLRVALSFFPGTRLLADNLFQSIFSSVSQVLQGIISYIPNLCFICVIGLFTFYVLKFIRYIFAGIEEGKLTFQGFEPVWSRPTSKIVQFLFLALVAVIIFPYLPGSGSGAFQGISLFLGVLISLGSSSAISNIIAGVLLTYIRSFNIGEEVEVDDVLGVVVEKSLLFTRIRTGKNYYINIPNSKIITSNVTSFKASSTKIYDHQTYPILSVQITIDYATPCSKVHKLLLAAASEVANILSEPAPGVAQKGLSDLGVDYSLYFYTDNHPARYRIYSDLYRKILEKCTAENINLFNPQFVALLDGIEPPYNSKVTEFKNSSNTSHSAPF